MRTIDILTVAEAAEMYEIQTVAIARMQNEGLLRVLFLDGKYYVLADDLRRIAGYAVENPRYLSCVCLDGPCECLTSPSAPLGL
jgi:hypothetical protein